MSVAAEHRVGHGMTAQHFRGGGGSCSMAALVVVTREEGNFL
jgi:hypothetical protein